MEDTIVNEIAERMGEAVHQAWMEKRMREKGWHNPKYCPNHQQGQEALKQENGVALWCPNCHSCMRPYAELPDSEKELDRQYPRLFFRILTEMGYAVVKIEDGND